MIAPITLPAPAYRLTWLAKRLERLSHDLAFEALLKQVAPAAFATLRPNRGDMDAYNVLLNYIEGNLFPVWTGVDFGWAEEEGEINEVGEAMYFGIPVEPLGYDRDSLFDPRGSASIALMYVCTHWGDAPLARFEPLTRYRPALQPLLTVFEIGLTENAKAIDRNIRPPRGRAWRAPWDGLADLCDYAASRTGNAFLDYSHEDLAEMDGNPAWHIEEIRGLTRAWAEAKPMWARIQKLREHLDADPARRLPQLLEVLTGHDQTRQRLSRPKAEKTLMDILK